MVQETDDKINCPFFEELSEIFGHRPIIDHRSGVDSITLSSDPSTVLIIININILCTNNTLISQIKLIM